MIPSSKKIASGPWATSIAPTMPPISACDELDGRPKYQVIRFQAIAPIRPPKTTSSVTSPGSTTSLATVAATLSEMKAPTKFSSDAYPTASRGAIARVEIDVATTLAVSWKPFVKSNASAVPTTMMTVRSSPRTQLRVLDDDAFEDVGHALGGVDRLFQALEDVLPADHHHRVDAVVEQRRDRLARDSVAVVLEAVDLDCVVRDVFEAAQPRHRLGDLARGGVQHVSEVLPLRHRRLDLVEPEVVGDLLGVIDHVVERGRQRVDVLAVDRRDEGLVEPPDDVVGDPVPVLLADEDVAGELAALGERDEHVLERARGAQDVAAGLLEEIEDLPVTRGEDAEEPHRAGRYH